MYIRQTKTNNTATGESYFTHRLVRGERVQGKVRQMLAAVQTLVKMADSRKRRK